MSCLMYSIPDKDFLELIRRSSSIREVLEALGYTNDAGKANLLFHERCDKLGIDWKKELRTKNYTRTKRTFENVFCLDSTADQTTLRSWYQRGKYSEYKCAICGIVEWNGQELVLRLDHINGNNRDNRLSNLRWLCPNCDSQTSTYCGRNLKHQPFKNGNYCVDCGKPITKQTGVVRCEECSHKRARKVKERPSKEELYRLLKESNFLQVGKKYGVTDNTIRKWCKSYGLSTKSKDYREKKEKKIFNSSTNKPCNAYDKDGNFLKTFDSIREAAEWTFHNSKAKTLNGISTHITEVCDRRRKTAYGYIWQYRQDTSKSPLDLKQPL